MNPPSLAVAARRFYYDSADSLVELGEQSSGGGTINPSGSTLGVWNIPFGESKDGQYRDLTTGKMTVGSFTYAAYGTLKLQSKTYDDVVMISNPSGKNFFITKPFFGLVMKVMYSAPNTIAGAYINSFGSTAVTIAGSPASPKNHSITTQKNSEIVIDLADYSGNCDIKIVAISGKTVYQNTLYFGSASKTVSINNVNAGVYFVELKYNNGIEKAKVYLTK
jgi:hypothetical protein